MLPPMSAVFRFAPSPNGFLHAGHAVSALLNDRLARECGGTFLLRIEDIDVTRCTRAFADAIEQDLRWLGLTWPEPVRRQSEHVSSYHAAQATLADAGLLYPCFCTRGDIARDIAGRIAWPRDPDGAPVYPGACRALSAVERRARMATRPHAWRLDMSEACRRRGQIAWVEEVDGGAGTVIADPLAWGDVVLARKDIGTSYHVAVVVDDAAQGITHVVRGRDLFAATAIHRVLQTLLGLPAPVYRHHALARDDTGEKLAKSRLSTPLRKLRDEGMTPAQLRARLGFGL